MWPVKLQFISLLSYIEVTKQHNSFVFRIIGLEFLLIWLQNNLLYCTVTTLSNVWLNFDDRLVKGYNVSDRVPFAHACEINLFALTIETIFSEIKMFVIKV